MESEIIQPFDYVTTCLLPKLKEAKDCVKKSKRPKLHNYLALRFEMLVKGFANELTNSSTFMKAFEKYRNENSLF